MTELDFIDWLRTVIRPDPRVPLGPGDDCAAVVWPTGSNLLVATDMLLEGSCFRLAEAGPRRVGRKAMAVNLSDMAAMAGQPVAAVVSVGVPRGLSQEACRELFLGLADRAQEFETAIVGGDTNSWDGGLTISVTLLGTPTGSGPVRRSGAKPGDWLFVTGPLGGSIQGHHLDFMPRVREGQRLHAETQLRAMIDLSDGLATDLRHLCRASGWAARLEAARIPLADAPREANSPVPPLERALGDGEDFELLFAVAPAEGARLLASQPLGDLGCELHHIGECLESGAATGGDLWLTHPDGRTGPLMLTGYTHTW